jgi:hypothetical protein
MYSRFIPEKVAEASVIFLRAPTFYQNDLAMRNTTEVTASQPVPVWSQTILGVRDFKTSHIKISLSIPILSQDQKHLESFQSFRLFLALFSNT